MMTKRIEIVVDEEDFADIERLRGLVPRATWVRNAVTEKVAALKRAAHEDLRRRVKVVRG